MPVQYEFFWVKFQRLVSRSASSGSVPRYCCTLPRWYGPWWCLSFCSGIRVTGLLLNRETHGRDELSQRICAQKFWTMPTNYWHIRTTWKLASILSLWLSHTSICAIELYSRILATTKSGNPGHIGPNSMTILATVGIYHIAGNFGRELNLVVWQTASATAKISYSHIYIWRSCTEPPQI